MTTHAHNDTSSQQRTQETLSSAQYDANTRAYLMDLLAGQKPASRPDVGPQWSDLVDIVERQYLKSGGNVEVVTRVLHDQGKMNPELNRLLNSRKASTSTRNYLLAMKAGQKPAARPLISLEWAEVIEAVEYTYNKSQGDPVAVSRHIELLIKSGKDPRLAELLEPSSKQKQETKRDQLRPPLPEAVCVPSNFKLTSSEAYQLLLTYAAFSKKASPEGYEDFHIFCGLWLLSVIAARRVYIHQGREKLYTNLRIALCAESTDWAKSTTAKAALSVAEEAGFHHLLIRRGKITAERLVQNMTGKLIPSNYSTLKNSPEMRDQKKAELIKKKMAFAGQKTIYWDEQGKFLKSMMKENSSNASFQDLLLQIDDCAENGNDTVGRGDEAIEKPYLPILGSLIPSTMKNIARAGSELWKDGFFARNGFVCAPQTAGPDSCIKTGYLPTPPVLIQALQEWNEQLGEAEIDIDVSTDEKTHKEKITVMTLKELPERSCILKTEVENARETYRSTLKKLSYHEDVPPDLRASYGRLATTALRIAMLIASLEDRHSHRLETTITLTHWAVAQELTEMLRENLHKFYAQVNGYKTYSAHVEDEIMDVIKKQTNNGIEWFTPNDIGRLINRKYSTKEINDVLQPLKDIRLEWEPSKHAPKGRYKLIQEVQEDEEQE